MVDIIRVSFDSSGAITAVANVWIVLGILLVAVLLWAVAPKLIDFLKPEFSVSEAEIGIGTGRIKIVPNREDLQIAYRLWVELKTRKLGLPFDADHDVIVEVYNSWHEFFKITRELIKTIPVEKVRGQRSTKVLVGVLVDVLNKAIRPHLTKWQARYRHWFELEVSKPANTDIPPQELQSRYPNYNELVTELKATNAQLVEYTAMLMRLLEVNQLRVGLSLSEVIDGTDN